MAEDVSHLMDVLKIDSAHIVGGSMGGMITQAFGISYPHRCKSLSLIMTTAGNRNPLPTPELQKVMFTVRNKSRVVKCKRSSRKFISH